MKKLLLTTFTMALCLGLSAQNNSFPTTGHAEINHDAGAALRIKNWNRIGSTFGGHYAYWGAYVENTSSGWNSFHPTLRGSLILNFGDKTFFSSVPANTNNASLTHHMTIDNVNNRVGIGTDSPYAKLHLFGGSTFNTNEVAAGQDHIIMRPTAMPGNGGFFGGLTWQVGGRRRAAIAATQEHSDTDYVGLAFFTKGTDGPGPFYESMRLTHGGSLGIGTTTPAAMLDVLGASGLIVRSSTHPDAFMKFQGSVSVANLNPGGTTAASIITGRPFGHTFIDIPANDINDSFAVRTDTDFNGTVDNIAMVIKADGDFGIGTTSPTEKLEVNGNARIVGDIYSKKVKVTTNASNWPDYVFESDYDLTSLSDLEAFIKTNKHLPEVPAASEVEANGQDLGNIQSTLLKKIEELTLYMIEQDKKQLSMEERMKKLEAENAKLKKLLEQQ